MKVDLEGNIIDPGNSGKGILRAGFIIHSAIHKARPDLQCIAHTHTVAGSAVSCMKFGLLPLHQLVQLLGEITYHDYEGVATDEGERERLVKNLGPKSKILILRNHGLLTAGGSVGEAVKYMYQLEKSCQIQIQALSAGYENLVFPSKESQDRNDEYVAGRAQNGKIEFEAIMRQVEEIDPKFKL